MEITYKKGALTVKLVKHNKIGNLLIILYRIAKNLLRRGHGTDLVQLTQFHVFTIIQPTCNCTFRQLLFYFLVYGSANIFFFFKLEKRNYFRLFIFILSSDATILSSLILKQGVQGLQAFAFCILAVIDEHMKQTQVQNEAQGSNINTTYVLNCV